MIANTTHTKQTHVAKKPGAATEKKAFSFFFFSLLYNFCARTKKRRKERRGLDGGSVPARLKSFLYRQLYTQCERERERLVCTCCSSPHSHPPLTLKTRHGRRRGEGSGRETTTQNGDGWMVVGRRGGEGREKVGGVDDGKNTPL